MFARFATSADGRFEWSPVEAIETTLPLSLMKLLGKRITSINNMLFQRRHA